MTDALPIRAVANGGVWGGCDTPPGNKLSANEGICRQTKNNIPQNVKLNRDIQQNSPQRHKKVFSGGIPPPPPPCTGHYQSCQVSRFTRESPGFRAETKQVGQYSLHSRAILAYNKEKWDKFCQFCEKLCYFVIS